MVYRFNASDFTPDINSSVYALGKYQDLNGVLVQTYQPYVGNDGKFFCVVFAHLKQSELSQAQFIILHSASLLENNLRS